MKYRIMILCVGWGFMMYGMKDQSLSLEIGDARRNPFAWDQEQKETPDVMKENHKEKVAMTKIRKIERLAWHVYGIVKTSKNTYALLQDADQQRLVQPGSVMEGGWKVSKITSRKIIFTHETGEEWITEI